MRPFTSSASAGTLQLPSMSGRCCSTHASENSMGSPTASSSMRTTVFPPRPGRCSGSAAPARSSRTGGARGRRRCRARAAWRRPSSNTTTGRPRPGRCRRGSVGEPARLDHELHRAGVDRDAVLLHHRDGQLVVAVAPAVRESWRSMAMVSSSGGSCDVAVELPLHVQQVHLLAGAEPQAVASPRVEAGLHLPHVREVLARDHTPDLVVVRRGLPHEFRRPLRRREEPQRPHVEDARVGVVAVGPGPVHEAVGQAHQHHQVGEHREHPGALGALLG